MSSNLRMIPRVLGALGVSCLLLFAALTAVHAQADAQAATVDPGGVFVNEVMADNKTTLVDPDEVDETPDWIELYNPGNQPLSLAGLALSDSPENPTKFPISDTLTIPARGYLVFFADEDTRQGPRHTNFKLGAGGETVGIYRMGDKVKIDELVFPALATDQSFGRFPDGGPGQLLDFATPGASNATDPPRISAVTEPPYPAPANTPISITAVVSDVDPLVSVSLVYSATTLANNALAAATVQTVTMTAAGANGYRGDLPALVTNTLVSYYVTAVDVNGERGRFPLEGQEYRLLTGYVAPNLVINEIVIENDTVPDPDEPAEYPDWLEIYNPTNRPISLNGLSVSDDKSEPTRFRIPPGLRVEAESRIYFLADEDPGQGPQHMNFALRNSGEFVGLFGGEGTVRIDSRDLKRPPLAGSYARLPDGGAWSDMGCFTFDEPNRACDQLLFMPLVGR